MDRFEAIIRKTQNGFQYYLHSSMDRFEAENALQIPCQMPIYIPVWIDLKFKLQPVPTFSVRNLHSSMDRFEGVHPS